MAGMSQLPAGNLTLMFTDIVGSTRLLCDLGPVEYGRVLAEHRSALRAVFAAHGGTEVDTSGDSFFVVFPTADGAVSAAVGVHEALAEGPVKVRIGMDTGKPEQFDGGYVGEVVHRAARIAALAHAGQVLLGVATRDLLDDSVPVTHLGRHRLKGFAGAVAVYQSGAQHFPALPTRGAVDLPQDATRFLGRDAALFDALRIIEERDPQVLTVVAPGGTGKTRFAVELARRLAERADGGTYYVALAAVRDSMLVLAAVSNVLGVTANGGDVADDIGATVGTRRTHLVLDNLEQLLPPVAAVLATLCAAAPWLRLFVTSREALRIDAEAQYELPPMTSTEAVELFLARAENVRPGLEPTAAVEQLCRRLDRLPLALELAAARTKLFGPDALLARLDSRLDLLTAGRDAEPRHATLRATIGWSYELLDPAQQNLFASLSVFRGGCTVEAAEQVCGAELGELEALLDKSLLLRRANGVGDRLSMHETIHEFAAERCHETGREDELRRAHARWLLEQLIKGPLETDVHRVRSRAELELAAHELDNIRAALDWATVHDPELGLRLATSLEQFWFVNDPVEGGRWLRQLLAAAPHSPALLRAAALRCLGASEHLAGANQAAEALFQEGLELIEPLDELVMSSHLRYFVGASAVEAGDGARGWPLIEEALKIFEHEGWPVRTAGALGYLSVRARDAGDLDEALRLRTRSLDLLRQADFTFMQARELYLLAGLHRDRADAAAAVAAAMLSADLAEQLHDLMTAVFAAAELACAAAMSGQPEHSGRLWGAIEAAEDEAPLGLWRKQRTSYVDALAGVARDAAFERGRVEGQLLSLPDAVAAAGRALGEAE
jgi:predicted ATPase/class 3 adenylate cyclase